MLDLSWSSSMIPFLESIFLALVLLLKPKLLEILFRIHGGQDFK
jgi:hypothetical protein